MDGVDNETESEIVDEENLQDVDEEQDVEEVK